MGAEKILLWSNATMLQQSWWKPVERLWKMCPPLPHSTLALNRRRIAVRVLRKVKQWMVNTLKIALGGMTKRVAERTGRRLPRNSYGKLWKLCHRVPSHHQRLAKIVDITSLSRLVLACLPIRKSNHIFLLRVYRYSGPRSCMVQSVDK